MVDELQNRFPLGETLETLHDKKAFVSLFGAILRMRNLLSAFDEFEGHGILSDRDIQDYTGRYHDIREELKPRPGMSTDVTDDIVFEVELLRQIEINIDYILILVKKYHDSHCFDKELLIDIHKAIDSSLELRSKKALIDSFIAGINDVDDVMAEWHSFVAEAKESELVSIIEEEKLKETETRKYLENCFRNGEIKTTGTDIDDLMPPTSHFGGGDRAEKKQRIIEKLQRFFERFFGIG